MLGVRSCLSAGSVAGRGVIGGGLDGIQAQCYRGSLGLVQQCQSHIQQRSFHHHRVVGAGVGLKVAFPTLKSSLVVRKNNSSWELMSMVSGSASFALDARRRGKEYDNKMNKMKERVKNKLRAARKFVPKENLFEGLAEDDLEDDHLQSFLEEEEAEAEEMLPVEEEEEGATFDDEELKQEDARAGETEHHLLQYGNFTSMHSFQDAIGRTVAAISKVPLAELPAYEFEEELLQFTIQEELEKHPEPVKPTVEKTHEVFEFMEGVNIPIGEFYEIGDKAAKFYFARGFAGALEPQYNSIQRVGFYLRPIVCELITQLRQQKADRFLNSRSLFIDGPKDSGKSAALNQLVYWARANDWLVLFIPSSLNLYTQGFIAPSTNYPGYYDNLVYYQEYCFSTLYAHADKLKVLKLRSPVKIDTFESTKTEPKTLFDLLKYGAQNDVSAGDAFLHFIKELNYVTEFPVLVAVDGVEHFFCDSKFMDPHSPKVKGGMLPGERFTSTKFLFHPTTVPLMNGTFVYSTTTSPLVKRTRFSTANIPAESRFTVPPYTKQDFHAHLDYFIATGLMPEYSRIAREYLYSYTSGLPSELWKALVYTPMGSLERVGISSLMKAFEQDPEGVKREIERMAEEQGINITPELLDKIKLSGKMPQMVDNIPEMVEEYQSNLRAGEQVIVESLFDKYPIESLMKDKATATQAEPEEEIEEKGKGKGKGKKAKKSEDD